MRFADTQRREEVFATVPWVMAAADERIRTMPVRRLANAIERVAVSTNIGSLGANQHYTPATSTTRARLKSSARLAIQAKLYQAIRDEFGTEISNGDDASVDTGLAQVDWFPTVSGGNLLSVPATVAPEVQGILLSISTTLAVKE
jgi:hypothetical protein